MNVPFYLNIAFGLVVTENVSNCSYVVKLSKRLVWANCTSFNVNLERAFREQKVSTI